MSSSSAAKLCAAAALFLFAERALGNPITAQDNGLTMGIVHTNDMHARFEETSRLSTACEAEDAAAGKCYGGFARIATLVRQARNSSTPTLFLNAGDTYQGTVWYNVYKWRVVSKFMNILAPDAVSLGNHEFDDGVDGLVPFIENARFPVLAANLNLTLEPTLAATRLANSTVLLVNGTKVGVIGYLTPDTKILSSAGRVIFKDEVECVREEAGRLKRQGVNVLIAVGHSGFEVDKRIAGEVDDIDLVIGGHTNTFLYNGAQPSAEAPEGLYPTEVAQRTGRKAYVVQAYAYTKYLGNFSVTFDAQGEVTHIEGNPILVDGSIEQAQDVLDELDRLRPAIENVTKAEIGKTSVLLDGDSKNCRRKECNMGNLITDAIIDYNAGEYASKDGWTDAAIAVQNSGSIRASISRYDGGKITLSDVLSVLPFENILSKVTMTGQQILTMLELSGQYGTLNSTGTLYGAFLQYSGIQVEYDLSRPAGSRVVSAVVQCAACRIPSYSAIEHNATYNVLVNDFMRKGGDGYALLMDLPYKPMAVTTADVLAWYLKRHSPVYPAVEWRIVYSRNDDRPDDSGGHPADGNQVHGAAVAYRPVGLTILLSVAVGRLLTS